MRCEKMDEILEYLESIIENPDDLSNLPQTIGRLRELNNGWVEQEGQYQERINNLQQANRNYLSQIPVTQQEDEGPPEDEGPTFEDAQQQLLNAMTNVGGN